MSTSVFFFATLFIVRLIHRADNDQELMVQIKLYILDCHDNELKMIVESARAKA